MVGILLDYYMYRSSCSSLKSKNVVKFYVYISPIFSCRVTYTTFLALCENVQCPVLVVQWAHKSEGKSLIPVEAKFFL